MKKILLFLILFIPFKIFAISSSAYIVMDMDSGRVLEGSNIDKQYLIASTTKILTAITAIKYGNLEDVVTINNDVLDSFGSGIYVNVGEKLLLDDLLYGLMLRSGNDAALAIASHVGGSVDNFVFLMNEEKSFIGMKNSIFINPSGLEDKNGNGNMSTVYDMALLMRYAMKDDDFRRITGTKEIVVKSDIKTYKWINKNKLLHSYKYCTGGKTGYTKKAKRTLVTAASKDGMNLIVVTFNDGNDFLDHEKLYDKYFNSYEVKKVIDKDKVYKEDTKVIDDFNIVVNDKDEVKLEIDYDGANDSLNGSIVGKVKVLLNGEEIGFRYLYYDKEEYVKKSFIKRLLELLNI